MMSNGSQMDELYRRLGDDLEEKLPMIERSEIAGYFAGKTLFITGATGFMGRCLVEKLLRSCSGVRRIYILMRVKKNESVELRLKKYFNNMLFDRLREACPKFAEKVTVMAGDVSEENLGLSPENRNTLVNEVNVILHNAANVMFNERVAVSLSSNILGTKYMLELAEECQQLRVFVYTSSAYSHCYRKDIDETFYRIPDDLDAVYEAIERDKKTEGGMPKEALKAMLGKFPNIYTYGKAFSEDLVRRYAKRNADCTYGVYRPSIVFSAYKEPLGGWYDNFNGPALPSIGAMTGIVRVSPSFSGVVNDLIPVDMSINAWLAITWDLGTKLKLRDEPSIYNYGSSTLNPVNLQNLFKTIKNTNNTSSKMVWLPRIIFTSSRNLFWVLHVLLHFLPACLGDLALMALGRRAMLVSIFLKVTKNFDTILFFGFSDWRIHCPKTMEIFERMNYHDKKLFDYDIRSVCWKNYVFLVWRGLMTFVLKENLQLNAGRRRYNRFWYAHYGLLTTVFILLCYLFVHVTGFFA